MATAAAVEITAMEEAPNRVFIVATAYPKEAIRKAGLPKLGEPHPDNPALVCVGKASSREPAGYACKVRVTYEERQ